MNWEHIGSCGNGSYQDDPDWKLFCLNIGSSYLKYTIGKLPSGCELGIMWHEDEIGRYPTIGLGYDEASGEPPWEIVDQCERLLEIFDESVAWDEIDPHFAFEDIDDDLVEDISDLDEFDDEDSLEDDFEEIRDSDNKVH